MDYFYTGIGSRQTPSYILTYMTKLAETLAISNYVLRSGHAAGADSAFELGCDNKKGKKEIYLPWKNFNGSISKHYNVPKKAFEIAEYYHPVWNKLSDAAKKLMARDVLQILGQDLKTPTNFIFCYTDKGLIKGGTGEALRIAIDYKIPIFNFGKYNNKQDLFFNLNRFLKWNQIIYKEMDIYG